MDILYIQLAINLTLLVAFPVAMLILSRTRHVHFSKWRGRIFAVGIAASLLSGLAVAAITAGMYYYHAITAKDLSKEGMITFLRVNDASIKAISCLCYTSFGGLQIAIWSLGVSFWEKRRMKTTPAVTE
ncbi:MAG: hypothetical protein R3C18_22085 [Planctomycetaceae bacterium]